jgi:hypothetical protein
MIKTEIILNKWLGDRFENDTECDCCGKKTSIMLFKHQIYLPVPGHVEKKLVLLTAKFCPACLDKFSQEITNAYCKRIYEETREKCQNM